MIWPFRPTDRRILDLRRKLAGMTTVATQLRTDKANLTEANKTLRRLIDIQTAAREAALADRIQLRDQLDRTNGYVSELEEELRQADLHSTTVIAERDELIARMEAELAECRECL